MKQIKAKATGMIIYKPTFENETSFFCSLVVNDFNEFKHKPKVMTANCYNACFNDVHAKIYTRDILSEIKIWYNIMFILRGRLFS